MSKADPVLVFGAGGHAKVVIDVLLSRGEWQPAAVFDDNVKVHGKEFHGSRVHGDRHALLAHARASGVSRFIVAVGNNGARAEVFRFLEAAGLQAVTAVHASAVVAPSARIGAGSVVMPGVCINADVAIGRNVIINTGACVDHDVVLGDAVHIAPGVHLCGGVSVGEGALVGVGASVIPGISIGANVLVAAGAVVVSNVAQGACVAGVPARVR